MKFDLSTVFIRSDGSFVVNHGMYHVPNLGEWKDLWEEINEYVKEHPEVVTDEPSTPEPTLDELKFSKLSEINAAYNTATSSLVSTYPDTELLTFDKQEQEARAWDADNTTSTPLIDALALGRGIDKAELVRRIIAKADAFAVATGYLTGQRQRYEDQLEDATTAEEVEAIVPEYTMPETTTEKVKLSLYYDL